MRRISLHERAFCHLSSDQSYDPGRFVYSGLCYTASSWDLINSRFNFSVTIITKMGSSIPPQPFRLAILECDSLEAQTREVYKNVTGLFTSLFTAAHGGGLFRWLGSQVCIRGYHVLNEPYFYPSLDDIDGILITGSRYNAFDDDPWIQALVAYTKKAIDTNGRVKVVGICFGHQIIGRALGAKVGKSVKGWELSVTEVNLTPEGKCFFQLDKLVSSSISSWCNMIQSTNAFSASIKCTVISSSTCPMAPSLLPSTASARTKSCISLVAVSLSKATRSSPPVSPPISYLRVVLQATF